MKLGNGSNFQGDGGTAMVLVEQRYKWFHVVEK